ncbi:MAG TPA: ACP S-malonyltransferase [Gammaproteobacteria bacterium]|nr:ACP S-malonyltransferase [Gammaproteobacteria bacterium]
MKKKLAFVFPGQGSQSLTMLGGFENQFPVVTETYQAASDALGYDLWALVQQGPEIQLNQTEFTQPALLVAGVALWRLWKQHPGQVPDFMAGHSLGEYTALVCAGAVDFIAAVTLVALRGKLMQEAVSPGRGAMAAIVGLENDVLLDICQHAAQGQILSPANYNSIGQTVLAGEAEAIARAIELALKAKAKIAKIIPVSVPSHCALMQPAAERLAEHLQNVMITTPAIPVVNNVDVACYDQPEKIRSALVRQLFSPVRWVETVQYLIAAGVDGMIECGPGKVLAGLNKRINADVETLTIATPESFQSALERTTALPL